jgi:hypothetical protein
MLGADEALDELGVLRLHLRRMKRRVLVDVREGDREVEVRRAPVSLMREYSIDVPRHGRDHRHDALARGLARGSERALARDALARMQRRTGEARRVGRLEGVHDPAGQLDHRLDHAHVQRELRDRVGRECSTMYEALERN